MKYSLRSLMIAGAVALSLACVVLAAKCVQMGLATYETPPPKKPIVDTNPPESDMGRFLREVDEISAKEIGEEPILPNSQPPAPNPPKP